jgi:hypothetical protein
VFDADPLDAAGELTLGLAAEADIGTTPEETEDSGTVEVLNGVVGKRRVNLAQRSAVTEEKVGGGFSRAVVAVMTERVVTASQGVEKAVPLAGDQPVG